MTKKTLLVLSCVLLLALITASSLCSFALGATNLNSPRITSQVQPTQRITQNIDERVYVPLSNNTRPEAKNAVNYRGPVAASMEMEHIFLFLQRSPQQEQALNKLIDELNDRKSPRFHKWLTAEQFGEQYGVAQEDIEAVTNWLQSHGLRINQVYTNRILIDFSGTAGQVGEAFHTEIGQLQVGGEPHIANMSDPMIPAALAPVVGGIVSLNDFKPHAMNRPATQYTFAGCTATTDRPTGPGTCYGMTPQDTQTVYNLTPLYNAGYSGQGQTIALVEDTDTYGTAGSNGASDWNTYRSTFGLSTAFPLGTYSQVHPGGCTDPGTNGDDGEAAIDVEVASSVAPSAAIELISCAAGNGGTTFGGLIAMQNLVNGAGPYPGVMSVSYGVCEAFNGNGGNQAFYNTYEQAATEGISVFGASGDEGPSSCSADFNTPGYQVASLGISGWTSTPYNVSVGGTDFEDVYNSKEGGSALSTYWNATNTSGYGSAKSYIPEMPWNDACANLQISYVARTSFTTYGSTGTCNVSPWDTTSGYLIAGAGSGGGSNCFSGQGGTDQGADGISDPDCQGLPKPSFQSGAALTGGLAVYGSPTDGVRDIPDVSMFAANGIWGHYEVICWSDPSQTSGGATSCAGAPSTWAGFGGTSIASPTMAGIQALINQETGETWGNPATLYYQIAQNEYGTVGGTFQGTSCNSSGSGGPAAGCAFNDVTEGDIDLACEDNGTLEEAHCYKPSGTRGVDSTDTVTAATVLWGGSGYTSAPTCTIAGPTNNSPYKEPSHPAGGTTVWAGGTQATCTATTTATSTTAVWTVLMSATTGVGDTIILTNVPEGGSTTCGPYTLTGSTTTLMASNLVTSIGSACSLATATSSTTTVTITGKTTGAAGNFITEFGPATEFDAFYVYITNTTKGQGPNWVSGITINTAGSGYAPETPITLGGPGTGAVAVANTSFSTAPTTYQPAYGAASGYDLATGLGTPNATNLATSCSWYPATQGINNPVPGSVLGGDSAVFQWGPYPGATNYWVDIGSTYGGNNYEQSGPLGASACSLSVNSRLPTNGSTVYVTWWYYVGGSWAYTEYTYVAYGGGSQIGVITSPPPTSTLTGSSQVFSWSAGTLSTAYEIDAGGAPGGNNYFHSGNLGNVLTKTVTGLPENGSTVYVTLYSLVGSQWLYNQYTYTAFNPSNCLSTITSPTPGTTLTAYSDTFGWTASTNPGCSGAVTNYWVDAGTTTTENFYLQSGPLGLVFSYTTGNDLPPGYGHGQPPPNDEVQMTLWNYIGGSWVPSPEVGYCGYGFSGYPACNTPTDGAGDPAPLRKMVKH